MSDEAQQSSQRHLQTRREFIALAAVSVSASAVFLAGCDANSTKATATPNPAVPTLSASDKAAIEATRGKTWFPSNDPNIPDVYTAPPPVLVPSVSGTPVTSGKAVSAFGVTFGPPETQESQNRFWQQLNQNLGAEWKPTLAAGNDVYAEKVGTLLASGSLPDLFFVNFGAAPSLVTAIKQGAFTDLTKYLTGDALNNYPNLAKFPTLVWNNAKINGKIYGVPRLRGLTGQTLLYRKDWAQKYGVDSPKNTDDFTKMMKAFTTESQWGMGFTASDPTLSPWTNQFFMNIFNVPNNWRRESNGNLTYFIETDEYRQAVSYMAQLYAAGIFYPDSLTQNATQMKANFKAGKYGAYVDGFTALPTARDPINGVITVDPKADVEVIVPFAANGGKANHWLGSGYFGFTSIPSTVGRDANRTKELLRVLNYLCAPGFTKENDFLTYGIDGYDNTPLSNGGKKRTQVGETEIGNLVNVANGGNPIYINTDPQYGFVQQSYIKSLLAIGVANPIIALAAASPTFAKQGATLSALMNDRVLRIVKGTDQLSALSSAISDWKSQGGDQVRKEYQDALK